MLQVKLSYHKLSRELITKAHIRLSGCVSWSAPLAFTCRFSGGNYDVRFVTGLVTG